MSRNKKLLFALMISALADVFIMPSTAVANDCPAIASLNSGTSTCASASAQHPDVIRLHDEILTANDLDEARALALAPTADALSALEDARAFIPFNEDLRLAESKLSDARSRIENAQTQDQVADEFSGMMLAGGLDEDRAAGVDVGGIDCNYSTGELIAIVIGLILGIIPGLILLVVLC